MLHRIYMYRMYVQEGLPWIWVHIYPVCMYFVGFDCTVLAVDIKGCLLSYTQHTHNSIALL